MMDSAFAHKSESTDTAHAGLTVAESFAEIYRTQLDLVWRAVRRLGIREADAEDAVQEVFLVAHNRLATFEGRSKMSTWLYGIAMNVVAARKRKAHVRREVSMAAPAEGEMDPSALPPEELDRARAARALEAALDAMPIEQRAVFTLFELDRLSCVEIAELTESPIGTVYSRLRLARESFERGIARFQARSNFERQSA